MDELIEEPEPYQRGRVELRRKKRAKAVPKRTSQAAKEESRAKAVPKRTSKSKSRTEEDEQRARDIDIKRA